MKRLALAVSLSTCVVANAMAFGAIAVDDSIGLKVPAYGFSVGSASRAQAERTALQYCAQYGSNCRVVVWFETCGAYAASARQYGYGYGASKADATADALKMCGRNDCEVIVAKCQ